MKRALWGVLVLIAAGVLSVPYVFGAVAQREFERMLHGAASAGRLTVVGATYEAGWFRTRARVILALPARGSGKGQPPRLVLRNTITHGPLPFAELGRYGFEPILTIVHTEIAEESLPESLTRQGLRLRIDTVLPMSLHGRSEVSVPPFRGRVGDAEVDWGGLRGALRFGIADGAIAGEFTIAPGTVAAPERAGLSGLELSFDYRPGRDQLMVGGLSGRLERLSVEAPEKLSVESLRLTSSTTVRGTALEWIASLDFGRATVAGVDYDGGSVELVAHRLDTEGYAGMRALVESILLNEASSPNLFKPMRAGLGRLAAAAPGFELTRLRARSSLGEISASAKAGFAGTDPSVAGNPLQALHHFEAELHAAMPRAWLETVAGAGFLRTALARGWLAADGDDLRLAASYRLGELVVNGRVR